LIFALLITFHSRGKKVFKKFVDGESTNGAGARTPMTRSSLKPVLLFPTTRAEKSTHVTEDEEAETDVEEPMRDAESETVSATPKAARFGPASPPTSSRATRSRNVERSSSPAGPASDDELASFQRRLRSNMARKRAGAPLFGGPEDKRLRR
jgi:hypothetical protein